MGVLFGLGFAGLFGLVFFLDHAHQTCWFSSQLLFCYVRPRGSRSLLISLSRSSCFTCLCERRLTRFTRCKDFFVVVVFLVVLCFVCWLSLLGLVWFPCSLT